MYKGGLYNVKQYLDVSNYVAQAIYADGSVEKCKGYQKIINISFPHLAGFFISV